MYVKEPHLAVRGMYPGHSNVISTPLIHSRSLNTPGTLPGLLLKHPRNLRVMPIHIGSTLTSLPPFLAEETQMIFLTWRFAHFRKPHHINSEKEIKTYSLTRGPCASWVLYEHCWTPARHPRSLSSSWLSSFELPEQCLWDSFQSTSLVSLYYAFCHQVSEKNLLTAILEWVKMGKGMSGFKWATRAIDISTGEVRVPVR